MHRLLHELGHARRATPASRLQLIFGTGLCKGHEIESYELCCSPQTAHGHMERKDYEDWHRTLSTNLSLSSATSALKISNLCSKGRQ